jgi:DNA helicase-2/ATP-dependent DNA helicase PcrA
MARHRLTDEQKVVAASSAPLVFVESVPGSGKTTVAAERFGVLRHYVHRDDQRGIVAVSFARSAVAELRGRIEHRWGTRTVAVPNWVTTMDGLHRAIVEFLLHTGRVRWPGGIMRPRLIDSWARQRGASRITVGSERNQRWELALSGDTLAVAFRVVETTCWGMAYAKRSDYVDALSDGVCTHDEIRQIVGLALGRPVLRTAIDEYLARSFVHLIVDEAFDLNGLDALIVRRAIESGIGITLVGDPWQALYEWRGARPDMVYRLLADHSFVILPMHTSFRFRTRETSDLAARLRAGQAVTLLPGGSDSNVVLACEWDHLLTAGADVLPLSFGQLDCQTDASLVLVLDAVAQARLGEPALGVPEALRCLRRAEDSIDLEDVLGLLRDPTIAINDVMAQLRLATKVQAIRLPSLPSARIATRLQRLGLLREWLLAGLPQVPGLSVHQAKGREWSRVDVVLDDVAHAVVTAGLDETKEDHRKLYVALTRGRHQTRVRRI